ncbi:VirB3 family type IV secretion system protein [Acidithiobacillus sp.]|uniref:VirB3 family type IV secretion system protein n=1 Tax=Acidithiobacillus sp. TaxID=1872118 RepID=UPI003D08DCD7
MDKHTTPLHASLNRPILLLNGDRELVAASIGLGVLLVLSLQSIVGLVAGVALTSVLVYAVQRFTTHDAQFWPVFRKSLRYGKYFPAQSHYNTLPPEIRQVRKL